MLSPPLVRLPITLPGVYTRSIVSDGLFSCQRLAILNPSQAVTVHAAAVSQAKRLLLHHRQTHDTTSEFSMLCSTRLIHIYNAINRRVTIQPSGELRIHLEPWVAVLGTCVIPAVARGGGGTFGAGYVEGVLEHAREGRVLLELGQTEEHCDCTHTSSKVAKAGSGGKVGG